MDRRGFLRRGAAAFCGAGALEVQAQSTGLEQSSEGQWTILVTIDTLRADHCGCYGYPRTTTPFLDELAVGGVRFDWCRVAVGTTYPSHASLFTGLELPQHGIASNRSPVLAEGANTLATMFSEHGYSTGAVVSAPFLWKLQQGFQHFDNEKFDQDLPYRWSEHTVQAARRFLEGKRATEDVFLWLHVFDPHEWMNSKEPQAHLEEMEEEPGEDLDKLFEYWTVEQGKHVKVDDACISGMRLGKKEYFISKQLQYDSRIRYTDKCLRDLFRYVEANGPKKNTLWIVTADHGEALGNHRYDQHGRYLYDDILRVPLIVYESGGRFGGTVVEEPVGHIDVWPTLAERMEWAYKGMLPRRNGRSLLSLLNGNPTQAMGRRYFAHRKVKHPNFETGKKWVDDFVYCLHDGSHKYIVRDAAEDEFYDLREDPLELANLVVPPSSIKEEMRDMALKMLADLRADSLVKKPSEAPATTSAEEEALRALGYI